MHASGGGSLEAMKKLKAISAAFGGAIIHRVASYYAVGILYDWHVFTWYDPFFLGSPLKNATNSI
jgi:hypothetical protein